MDSSYIVGKKWDPGILDPGRFSAQIRKVEARLGKLVKIRKVEANQESSSKRLGKLEVRPKKKEEKKRSSPNFGLDIRKVEPNQESSLGKFLLNIRKILLHIRKIPPQYQENSASKNRFPEAKTLFPTMVVGYPKLCRFLFLMRITKCIYLDEYLLQFGRNCMAGRGGVAPQQSAPQIGRHHTNGLFISSLSRKLGHFPKLRRI